MKDDTLQKNSNTEFPRGNSPPYYRKNLPFRALV